jgi:outer membrane autotransporter protein
MEVLPRRPAQSTETGRWAPASYSHQIHENRARLAAKFGFPGFYESESASYGGDTGQLFTELAYPIVTDRSSAVEPFAGLAYEHVGTDKFTESGPTAALSTPGSDQNVSYATLGVRAATTMPVAGMVLTPRASVAWQYAFGELRPDIALAFASSGIAFGISGVPLARNSALIEAGLDFALGADAMLGVSYSGQLAGDLQDNGMQGRLTWRF